MDELSFDDYSDIIKYNANLTTVGLWVECLRQWLIIVITIALSILFIHSIRNLKRTQQGIDLDQLILWAELVKVNHSTLPSTTLSQSLKSLTFCLFLLDHNVRNY